MITSFRKVNTQLNFKLLIIMSKNPGKTSMLEYCKLVLKKMSFNRKLFRKEYKKTFTYLDPMDQSKLRQWLRGIRVRS